MPFLPPKQQRQSTEANNTKIFKKNSLINIGNIKILYLIFEHK